MGTEYYKRPLVAPDYQRSQDGQTNRLIVPSEINRIVKRENFDHGVDISAVADTNQVVLTPGGFRLFGDGLNDADNGGLLAVAGQPAQRLSSSNVDNEVCALGLDDLVLSPDTQGPMRLSAAVLFNNIDTKHVFLGFIKTAIDAMPIQVSYGTTVLTTVATDLAGVTFSTDLTVGDRWFVVHSDNNSPATNDTGDAGIDTGKDPVAAKLTLIDLSIDPAGNFNWVIRDDAGLASGSIALAVDVTETFCPLIYVGAGGNATEEMDVYSLEVEYFLDSQFI